MIMIIQNIKTENLKDIRINEKYTILYVSEMMAVGCRREITIRDIKEISEYAQYKNVVAIYFTEGRKRNQSNLIIKDNIALLKGWDLGIKLDSDGSSFSGNALINITSDEQEARKKIEELNVNPYFRDENLRFVNGGKE